MANKRGSEVLCNEVDSVRTSSGDNSFGYSWENDGLLLGDEYQVISGMDDIGSLKQQTIERGTIMRDADDGIVRFNPPLLHQEADRPDRGVAGKNVGMFLTYVIASAYGGIPVQNGNGGGFHPDIKDETIYGDKLTEVKACSFHASQTLCGEAQLRGYGEELLQRLDAGQQFPSVDYAIIRYGNNSTSPAKLSQRQLMAHLPRIGRSLLIMPYPLVLASAILSPSDSKNHSTSDSGRNEECYRILKAGFINSFHKDPRQVLDDIEARLYDEDLGDLKPEDFHLQDLAFGRSQYPQNIWSWGHNIRTFPVLQFDLNNPQPWLETFYNKADSFLDLIADRVLEESVEEEIPI